MPSKYRPIDFNAQAVASETLTYRDLRTDFMRGGLEDFTAYCLDAPAIVPTGQVTVSAPGRLPTIVYAYREGA